MTKSNNRESFDPTLVTSEFLAQRQEGDWESLEGSTEMRLPNQNYKDVAPHALPAPVLQHVIAVDRKLGNETIASLPWGMYRESARPQEIQLHTRGELEAVYKQMKTDPRTASNAAHFAEELLEKTGIDLFDGESE